MSMSLPLQWGEQWKQELDAHSLVYFKAMDQIKRRTGLSSTCLGNQNQQCIGFIHSSRNNQLHVRSTLVSSFFCFCSFCTSSSTIVAIQTFSSVPCHLSLLLSSNEIFGSPVERTESCMPGETFSFIVRSNVKMLLE